MTQEHIQAFNYWDKGWKQKACRNPQNVIQSLKPSKVKELVVYLNGILNVGDYVEDASKENGLIWLNNSNA